MFFFLDRSGIRYFRFFRLSVAAPILLAPLLLLGRRVPGVAIESKRVDFRSDDELLVLTLQRTHQLPAVAIGLHLLIDSLLELLLELAARLQSLLYVHFGMIGALASSICTSGK